ncbi:MAG: hypothetical protein H7328_01095 [Bdellovibrio sp.]|nr:hypothetical protein [Bdellovibrio sp.]
MKTITLTIALLVSTRAWSATETTVQPAPKTYSFAFKTIKEPIRAVASSKDEAFKLAAKVCFNQLTGGKYPGEEKGLDIIDICANPKM